MVGGFLEEEDHGPDFARDVVSAEDGDHLVGQDADFGGVYVASSFSRHKPWHRGGRCGRPPREQSCYLQILGSLHPPTEGQ